MPIVEGFPQLLKQALAPLGRMPQCALLNYPNHLNIGDHMIWAGTVDYLQRVNQTSIDYTADLDSYSPKRLDSALSAGSPILLHGGGSLGDLWPDRQTFHQRVVADHPHRPIFLMPQSMHFQDPSQARRAAEIFNAHGRLTLFLRDRGSFARASELFHKCRVHLSPDMALQLSGLEAQSASGGGTTLLLTRRDRESVRSAANRGMDGIEQDWVSLERKWRWGHAALPLSRTLARWYREGWQRHVLHPREFRRRTAWLNSLRANPDTAALATGPGCEFSMGLIWDGRRQLRAHRALVTDRLHAHLLAVLIGMPTVLRPNSYDKNKSFHETWLTNIPSARFVANEGAVSETLAGVMAAKSRGTNGFK